MINYLHSIYLFPLKLNIQKLYDKGFVYQVYTAAISIIAKDRPQPSAVGLLLSFYNPANRRIRRTRLAGSP
jgi:hypothetical protein